MTKGLTMHFLPRGVSFMSLSVDGEKVGVLEDDICHVRPRGLCTLPVAYGSVSCKPFPVHFLQGLNMDVDVVVGQDIFLFSNNRCESPAYWSASPSRDIGIARDEVSSRRSSSAFSDTLSVATSVDCPARPRRSLPGPSSFLSLRSRRSG